MAGTKQRLEHRFTDNGTPEGIVTTVEKVPYVNGTYGLSRLEFWRSACITTWVLIALYVIFTIFPHH